MRIVAGRFKGRSIASPSGDGARPTSDRVRESVFNVLAHGVDGFRLDGCRVIDLFAGTGALGLEAISRGAAYALFVEQDAERRGIIRTNVDAFGLGGITRILKRDATRLGAFVSRAEFDLAFLDPPYGKGLAELALSELVTHGWLAPGGIVVVEEARTSPVVLPEEITALDVRTYGDTCVTFGRLTGPRD